jgi:sugar/nucleoside kinase (ribokinase family)
MLTTEYDVIVAGHLCLDLTPEIPNIEMGQVFRAGRLVNASGLTISTGGPVSNTGMGLRTLGVRVGLVGKVGDDEFGRLAVERLRRAGNVDGIRIATGESTSYTIAFASSVLDRMLLHYPGVNDSFCFADINSDLLPRAKHFHFGYPPLMRRMYEHRGAELVRIFEYAKACGLTTSLDMSLQTHLAHPAVLAGLRYWKTFCLM